MDILVELKRKLCVTWDEDDAYLLTVIEKSKAYLDKKCGYAFNYTEPGQPRTLMLERCFYDYNNALKDFENNYCQELLALIIDTACDLKRGWRKCTN